MSKLVNLIKYICKFYPHPSELSKARLTKMVYLVDWEFARRYGRQVTDIRWYFNNYGPYVDDVVDAAVRDVSVNVVNTTTIYGTPKVQVQYIGDGTDIHLDAQEVDVADSVIQSTKTMYWSSFIRYVYDTYPIRENPRYSHLDLVELAEECSRRIA